MNCTRKVQPLLRLLTFKALPLNLTKSPRVVHKINCDWKRTFQTSSLKNQTDKIKVHFVLDDGTEHVVEGDSDETLYDLVVNSEVEVEGFGACGGVAACSTCHLVLEQKAYNSIEGPGDHELDILEHVPVSTETSRLGCQVYLCEHLNESRVIVPTLRSDLREN